MSTDNSKLV